MSHRQIGCYSSPAAFYMCVLTLTMIPAVQAPLYSIHFSCPALSFFLSLPFQHIDHTILMCSICLFLLSPSFLSFFSSPSSAPAFNSPPRLQSYSSIFVFIHTDSTAYPFSQHQLLLFRCFSRPSILAFVISPPCLLPLPPIPHLAPDSPTCLLCPT